MNSPTFIFGRTRRRSPAATPPPSRPDSTATADSPPAAAVHLFPSGRRITALDVQLAEARNEPCEGVTMREVDEQIRDARAAKNHARFDLLAEHRLRMVARRQADAQFPGGDAA